MSAIRCIYSEEPNFPASDQHPDAVRYRVGGWIVDAIGGEPTLAEIEAVLNPPKDPRVVEDEAQREACKADGPMLVLINQTRAEWATWAQNNFPSLTVAERNRIGVIAWLLSVAIRRLMR